MSDTEMLELRVLLTRLASDLAVTRSERDPRQIAGQLHRVRSRLDALLTRLPAA